MSHDEIGGPVTRKERRAIDKALGKRRAAPRSVFTPSAHIRNDWTPDDVIESLESRAQGYNGMLRNFLCTAAHHIRVAGATIDRLEKALAEQMSVDGVTQYKGDPVGIEAVANISKRNQQPGRLSGSERAALKDFVMLVAVGETPDNEVMTEGRAMLAKVRKRALGDRAMLEMNRTIEVPDGETRPDTMNRAEEVGA